MLLQMQGFKQAPALQVESTQNLCLCRIVSSKVHCIQYGEASLQHYGRLPVASTEL